MPETAWAAAGLVLAAAIALAGTQLLRRQNSRLTDAQAAHEEAQADKANAETLEIVDGLAREWIERLERRADEQAAEIAHLRLELDAVKASHVRDVAVWKRHVGVLEQHINDLKPPPPPPRPVVGP